MRGRGLAVIAVGALAAGACTSLRMTPPETGTGGATAGTAGPGQAGTGGTDAGGSGGSGGTTGAGGTGGGGSGGGGTGGGGTGGGGTGGTGVEPAGLIAFWRFNEGGSTTVADSSGNGQPLTLSTGGGWTVGHEGGGFAFDGIDDVAGVQPVQDQKLWDYPTAPLTMSAWINPATGSTSRPFASVVARTHEDFLFQNFWLGLVNGRPGCRIHSPSKEGPTATTVAPVMGWTHIACTYGLSGDAILYVNGVEADRGATTQNLGPIPTAILIGASETSADGMHDFFRGVIDDVRMYNTTLTPAEVAYIASH